MSHMAKSVVMSLRWEVVLVCSVVQSPLANGFSLARSKESNMRTSMMLATLMALSLAACADQDTTFEGDTLPGPTVQKVVCPNGCSPSIQNTLDNGEWIPVGAGSFVNALTTVQGVSACSSLPATGQCAFACDPTAFRETLPVGTCAAIRCEFPDGGEVVVGGCH